MLNRLFQIFLVFISFPIYSQIDGDVSGDKMIDATDYIQLKEIVAGRQQITPTSDLNKDGNVNVADLLILENYIYKEGPAPPGGKGVKTKSEVKLMLGKVDIQQQTIEVLLENAEPVAAIQFELLGLGGVEKIMEGKLLRNGFSVAIENNRFCAWNNKGDAIPEGQWLIAVLKFTTTNFEEGCLTQPIVTNATGNLYPLKLGECASSIATVQGLEQLKKIVVGEGTPTAKADVDHDGYVNVGDVLIVDNFLNRGGPPPPGNDRQIPNNKVRITFGNVNHEAQTFEVYVQHKKPIAAFQFDIIGTKLKLAQGGRAGANDFTIKTLRHSICGFLDKGTPILAGKEPLLIVHYDTIGGKEACIAGPVFVNSSAKKYPVQASDCIDLQPPIFGCSDPKATNFDIRVTHDDGSCIYPPKPVKEPKPKPEPKPKREKQEKPKKVKEPKERKKQKEKNKKPKIDAEKISQQSKKESKPISKKQEKSPLEKSKKVKNTKPKYEKKRLEDLVTTEQDSSGFNPFDLTKVKDAALIPKVTSAERERIENPKRGLMLWDVDAQAFTYYDGARWKIVGVPEVDEPIIEIEQKRKGTWKQVNKKNEKQN